MSRVCFIGLLIIFMLQMAANCFTPIWALYTSSIGGDTRSAGIAILIFTWGTALFSSVTPLLNTKLRLSESTLLLTGIALDTLAVIMYFFIDDILYFYAAQSLLALGAGMQIPAFYVIYERNIGDNSKGFAFGVLDSSFYFAMGLGSIISALLYHHLNIQAVFSLMLALMIASALFALVFIRLEHNNKF